MTPMGSNLHGNRDSTVEQKGNHSLGSRYVSIEELDEIVGGITGALWLPDYLTMRNRRNKNKVGEV